MTPTPDAGPLPPARSLYWDDGTVVAVDQRALPHEVRQLRLRTADDVIDAVKSLAVRGAPAIGLAGGLGVALSAVAHTSGDAGTDEAAVRADAERLIAARPTAVNLEWGVRRAVAQLGKGPEAVVDEAVGMLREDAALNAALAERACALVESLTPGRPLRLLTHCNTGHLATGAVGTALGAVIGLAAEGRVESVLVDETRPLLQGSRLTAWELEQAGIPYRLCVDSAAAAAMARGMVDCVLVGADRIAANGDTANKIGTYGLAVAAARHGIPLVVVAPESTWDGQLADGAGIVVEERSAEEVTGFAGTPCAPAGAGAFNPAFDVTPAELITAIVTEQRVFRPSRADRPLPEPSGDHSASSGRIAGLIEEFPDHPAPGVLFRDLSALYAEPGVLAALADRLAERYFGEYDRVLAVESRGFVLGAALAARTATPLTLARKPGKLPGEVLSAAYALEYGDDRLELRRDAFRPGERVLCVDDVLATGGTLGAAARLVEECGAKVAGMAVVADLALGGGERLSPYRVEALWEVPA
ncbi:S-methyl-5-thioribose-1-phosphate isomerase [Streptomyces sp. WMMB 322]|uniref:S-methyl-5-thioribose-1-phosphate isomerase n=1 Tax=Streptomyces sp. WMMB 322 TaxID=1286821 RepID=UPI000823C736|nr:S-methyl-5-thioribose-1-phosphate isomerase [Streptomyces sp. WMMB 322]SCK10799.1 S-methyl-5-thioribose-1-phosphate isomerase/adenine phosphoribosyltransferase,TIGR01090 [Streptomyces sp. WMMB 322]